MPGKQQLCALGGKKENAHQLLCPDRLDWTALRPTRNRGGSKARARAPPGLGCTLSQRTPPQPCPLERRRGQPSSPISKLGGLGAVWQGNFGQPGDPAPRTEQGWAPGEMPPHTGWNQPVHLLQWQPDRGRQIWRAWWQASALAGSL